MKKTALLLLAALTLLASCAATEERGPTETKTATAAAAADVTNAPDAGPGGIPAGVTPVPDADLSERTADVDLTALSAQMAYAQLSAMMTEPAGYAGKTVKMRGAFAHAAEEDREFFVCYVLDATACCSQSLEFETDGTYPFPEAYPAENTEITVYGVFDTYKYHGYQMYRLLHAELSY